MEFKDFFIAVIVVDSSIAILYLIVLWGRQLIRKYRRKKNRRKEAVRWLRNEMKNIIPYSETINRHG